MTTPTIVNNSSGRITWANGANTITVSYTPTVGNALLVLFNIQNIGTATITVTDSQSNIYTQVATAGAGSGNPLSSQHAYVCPAIAAVPTSITVTLSVAPSLTNGSWGAMEINAYGGIDGTYGAANLSATGTTITVSAAATTYANDIYVMSLAADQALGTVTLTSPTGTTAISSTGNQTGGIVINALSVSSTGTPSATWTWTSTSQNLSAMIFAVYGTIVPNTALNPVNLGTQASTATGDPARVAIAKLSEDTGSLMAGIGGRTTTTGTFGTTTAAGGDAKTFIDVTQAWTGNQFAGQTLIVTTGALPIVSGGAVLPQSNVGYSGVISSNTAHTIVLGNPGLPFTVALGTGYQVLQTPATESDGLTTQLGSNASTVIDASKTWTANQWEGYQMTLLGGAYAGSSRPIASNTTGGTVTLSAPLPGTTVAGTPYVIGNRPTAPVQYLGAGTTVTVNPGIKTLILDGPNTITVTFPAVPNDTDELHVCTSTAITSFAASAAGTVKGAPSTLSANTGVAWIYKGSNTTWYRLY